MVEPCSLHGGQGEILVPPYTRESVSNLVGPPEHLSFDVRSFRRWSTNERVHDVTCCKVPADT